MTKKKDEEIDINEAIEKMIEEATGMDFTEADQYVMDKGTAYSERLRAVVNEIAQDKSFYENPLNEGALLYASSLILSEIFLKQCKDRGYDPQKAMGLLDFMMVNICQYIWIKLNEEEGPRTLN